MNLRSECEWCGVQALHRKGKRFCNSRCQAKSSHQRRKINRMMKQKCGMSVKLGLCIRCNEKPKHLTKNGYLDSYCIDCANQRAQNYRKKGKSWD